MRQLGRVGTSTAGLLCLLSLWVGHPSGAQAVGTIVGAVTYKWQAQEEEFAPTKSPNADYCATLAKSKPDLKLVCNQHAYMQSWFLPVTNAYYAASTGYGRFEIHDVPAGKHTSRCGIPAQNRWTLTSWSRRTKPCVSTSRCR